MRFALVILFSCSLLGCESDEKIGKAIVDEYGKEGAFGRAFVDIATSPDFDHRRKTPAFIFASEQNGWGRFDIYWVGRDERDDPEAFVGTLGVDD